MEAKLDPEEEVKAIEWIETLTGELVEGDFHSGCFSFCSTQLLPTTD